MVVNLRDVHSSKFGSHQKKIERFSSLWLKGRYLNLLFFLKKKSFFIYITSRRETRGARIWVHKYSVKK